jgi:hypothetical protein
VVADWNLFDEEWDLDQEPHQSENSDTEKRDLDPHQVMRIRNTAETHKNFIQLLVIRILIASAAMNFIAP